MNAPYLTQQPPQPLNSWDPLLGQVLLWSKPYLDLDPATQLVAYSFYWAALAAADEQAQTAECSCDHSAIFKAGMDWARRQDEAALDRSLFDQFNAIRQSDLTPYWVLAERRGEPERAQRARQRAIERGYAW